MNRPTRCALIGAALLAGCSSDDGGAPSGEGTPSAPDTSGEGTPGEGTPSMPDVAPPGTLIEGVWQSPCLPGDGGQIGSRELLLSVTERVFEFRDNPYGSTGCTGEALQVFVTRGTFEEGLPEDMREISDGIPLDVAVDQVTLAPLLVPVADAFNAEALCGVTEWAPDVERDVSNCTAIEDSEAPRTDFTRFFVDDGGTLDARGDDTLYLGPLGMFPDPDARPELDRELAFRRRDEEG